MSNLVFSLEEVTNDGEDLMKLTRLALWSLKNLFQSCWQEVFFNELFKLFNIASPWIQEYRHSNISLPNVKYFHCQFNSKCSESPYPYSKALWSKDKAVQYMQKLTYHTIKTTLMKFLYSKYFIGVILYISSLGSSKLRPTKPLAFWSSDLGGLQDFSYMDFKEDFC